MSLRPLFPFLFAAFTLTQVASVDAQSTPSSSATSSFASQVQGWRKHPGFIEVWSHQEQAKVMAAVEVDKAFLMVSSLPFALGSNEIGLDRGQSGESKLVHFERHGKRVFLVQENTRYRADSPDADERAAVREAFAGAVLWSTDVIAVDGNKILIDLSSLLLSDRHGVATRLNGAKQGSYSIDDKRSAVLSAQTKNFPDNTELEALLTFAGSGDGAYVRQVAADAKSLRLHQHLSFVRLPELYQTRTYHPGSGGLDLDAVDFARPLSESIHVNWQLRHRLEKTDPTAALSTVKKPIVYYLDRGTPEPVRSALLDGARWWTSAFEKAGFKDAFRVELLPEGADAMDIRYNTITWVHRATRGWSYGNAVIDPRTGEIIKGAVTLGSQRVRQDILIAESLLAPYGSTTQVAKKNSAEQMALARLRQLAAHEVGHTLGLAHNFAPSRLGNGSAMDYPHPLIGLDAKGEITLNQSYGVGVGAWDDFAIAHIYGEFPDQEQALAQLRAKAKAGLLWDVGADSLQSFDHLMRVRQKALQQFSLAVLPPQRQLGELEARLVPIYLLHRYQVEAVARLIAGASYEYGQAQDANQARVQAGTQAVPAAVQRLAVQKMLSSLRAEQLALPQNVLDIVTPPSEGYGRSPEYFQGKMNVTFDPLSAVQAAAAHSCQFLLDPSRLNRLAWQHARDAKMPDASEMMRNLFAQTWQRSSISAQIVAGEAVQMAANWVVLDGVLLLLNEGRLHAQVDAQVRHSLRELASWLQTNHGNAGQSVSRKQALDTITQYLRDPNSVKLRPLPVIPPGAPI
ncbi:MAG: zinc-dependent metalloprotease [Burkholderiales bacterium]|nr:zinc-dependent metalloprotease [Burkholderiales bacterium]